MKKLSVLVIISMCLLVCQTAKAQITQKKVFKTNPVHSLALANSSVMYSSDGQVYTVVNYPAAPSLTGVTKLAMNPARSSYAAMTKKHVDIYSYNTEDKRLYHLKEVRDIKAKPTPVAMCYSPDSRIFLLSNSLGEIVVYSTRDYIPAAYIQTESPASYLEMSSNNRFIAAAMGTKVVLYNFETHEIRTTLEFDAPVTGIAFSSDATELAVTTLTNVCVYNTRKWELESTYNLEGSLSSPSFHPEGKYLSVVKNNNCINVINLKNYAVEQIIDENADNIRFNYFFKTYDNYQIISNRRESIVIWDANGLSPFYAKELNSAIDDKMNEWVKMMEGESMEDYAIRVNDETRLKQQQLFAQEIATEMAGDRIAMESPFMGEYDETSSTLNIEFNTLPPIALEVPAEERESFANSENLTFSNAVYTLNENDEFVLAYVEVLNETTNKVYIFDNIGRTKLNTIENDENFIPLEIMQMISMEEVMLEEIKKTVIEEHTDENLITDNTNIHVHTDVIKDVDANSNDIYNYKIGYEYEVVASADDDFPSGSFDINKAQAAKTLVKIIKSAFEGDFAKYLKPEHKVKIIITGSADASPIRSKIPYNAMYGEFRNEPYYNNGDLDNITLTKESGITTNQQLAFARGLGLKSAMESDISTLKDTRNEFEYHVKVSDQKGGQFRRISVEVIIYDAF